MSHGFTHDVVVIGGGGHVGLPLAVALADRGSKTVVYDVSSAAVDVINAREQPFSEPGAQPQLRKALEAGMLTASTDPATVATARGMLQPSRSRSRNTDWIRLAGT